MMLQVVVYNKSNLRLAAEGEVISKTEVKKLNF